MSDPYVPTPTHDFSGRFEADGIRLRVAVDPPRPVFWSRIQTGLRLDNDLSVPLLVLDAQVQTGDDVTALRWSRPGLPAAVSESGASAAGRRLVFTPSLVETDPQAPRWDWGGGEPLAPVALVAAGASFALHGPLQLTEAAGRRIRGVVRYLPLSTEVPLLSLAEVTARDLQPPEASAFGWHASHEAQVGYRWGYRSAQPGALPEGDTVEPYALPAGELARWLARAQVATTLLVFEVEPPAMSVEDARRKASVTGGPYTWFPHENAWAFEVRRETWLVGPDRIDRLPGRLVKLMEWVCRTDTAELVLFAAAAEPDPRGVVTWLREHGQTVVVTEAKAGSYRIAVTVAGAGLLGLVEALRERGGVVDGYNLRLG